MITLECGACGEQLKGKSDNAWNSTPGWYAKDMLRAHFAENHSAFGIDYQANLHYAELLAAEGMLGYGANKDEVSPATGAAYSMILKSGRALRHDPS